ncbi:MAG: hypothetical protein K0A90_06180 [Methanosarcinaceae archaeon]|nr:hypothetical protein [Methanosarcinaceae archaeon]
MKMMSIVTNMMVCRLTDKMENRKAEVPHTSLEFKSGVVDDNYNNNNRTFLLCM